VANTVLIDADILAFQVATAAEQPTQFGEDIWVLWADGKEAIRSVDDGIQAILTMTGASDYVLCLTGKNNFRYRVSDTYKSNRAGKRKPMILSYLREYMLDKLDAVQYDNLEGDDVIGILATGEYKDNHIIYSADKDLKTVAGKHFEDGFEITIEPHEALRYFYSQVLTGDTTDGYKGCPKVGPVKAAKILDADFSWKAVVNAYEKEGLTEDDAIIQARQAYILHDKDFGAGKVILWNPPLEGE